MKPKEKALELVEQFSSVLMYDEVYEDSIKCALIAVDEMLNDDMRDMGENYFEARIDYLEQVKQELEKL